MFGFEIEFKKVYFAIWRHKARQTQWWLMYDVDGPFDVLYLMCVQSNVYGRQCV